ncbi:MAG: hypothetical protein LBR45_01730, partial [Bacteroidales bacterium]|nr:hypothetical protein [Bacteroidales bacterium]
MKKVFRSIVILVFLLMLSGAVAQQSKASLESNKKKIEQEIKQTSELLEKTRRNKKNSVAELQLLNRNISKRQQLVSGLNKEITSTNSKIQKHSAAVSRLSGDITKLKSEYARMLQSSYLHKNPYMKIMYVLSSKDFSQAYRRIMYIRQYSDYLKKQVELIKAKQIALEEN